MRLQIMTLLRVAACLACLAAPAPVSAHPAKQAAAAWNVRAEEPPEKDRSCRQGKRTKDFGWLLVDYGLSTAKYVVGLFLIPIGLLLVCIGVVVEVVEAATC